MEQLLCLYLFLSLSKEKIKNNNLNDYRLKLIFLALCILMLLVIKRHITLGYAPELSQKSIAVAFDYYGAFEKEVEALVSRIEEAYMEVGGIKSVSSVSEPGKGYVLCLFSDKTSLDEAYVQISDITAHVWADFPDGVNRPVIFKSSNDNYPIYISYYSLEAEPYIGNIKEAYEAIPGVGEVQIGGRKKKELMIELNTDLLSGMALPSQEVDNKLRNSNIARNVVLPDGHTLVLSSRLSTVSDFGQVQVAQDLKLSDIANLEYKQSESQSLGYIDGQPMLLFFVMKSGEGNTVRLCRELDAVTSHFGGSQFYSLGNKIEKSFIVSSLILLLLFIFLFLNLWFKTRSFHLAAQAICSYSFSLLVAITAVTAAGFQVDMTVMAALFLVVIFKRENNSILYQTEINNRFNKEIDKLAEGKLDNRHEFILGKPSEILSRCGVPNVDITLLASLLLEKAKQHGFNIIDIKDLGVAIGNPIAVFNYKLDSNVKNVITELNQGNRNLLVAIKIEGKDGNIDIADIRGLFPKDTEKWLNWINQGLERYLNIEKIQDIISQQRTNLAEVTYLDLDSIKNILNEHKSVNNYFPQVHTNLMPIVIILSTLIITLYAPVRFKNLILPFCIALSSGLCASAVCRYLKDGLTPRIRVPLWCYTPILLFVLFLISNSSLSSVASDVSFSMEYENGTSFSFIEKSALDVEAALLEWNAFDHLTLHIDQGRASFTILGGKKHEIMAKISELSSFYPEIFFYIPEKHTSHTVDVTVYGNDVPEIENNILQLAKYVNESDDNVNIIYNFKSDVTNIVLEVPVKCASAGLYPYDVYKTLYYVASEPVVDKYFVGDVETDVKIRGDARYRKTLSGLLAVPVLSPFGAAGEAGDYITVHKESAQGRIYHKNRMRSMSLSVTGISRSKLGKIVSDFPFTGSCHGEVGQ